MTYDSPEALKASDEYQALGVLGRERLLWATFPELRERHLAKTAEHLTAAAHGLPQPRKEHQ